MCYWNYIWLITWTTSIIDGCTTTVVESFSHACWDLARHFSSEFSISKSPLRTWTTVYTISSDPFAASSGINIRQRTKAWYSTVLYCTVMYSTVTEKYSKAQYSTVLSWVSLLVNPLLRFRLPLNVQRYPVHHPSAIWCIALCEMETRMEMKVGLATFLLNFACRCIEAVVAGYEVCLLCFFWFRSWMRSNSPWYSWTTPREIESDDNSVLYIYSRGLQRDETMKRTCARCSKCLRPADCYPHCL